jgi:PAS domain S-box-containing protein
MTLDETAQGLASPETAETSVAILRGLMQTALVGFAVVDSKGRIVDANEAFALLLGYTRRELLESGLDWHRLTPPEHAESDRAAIEEMNRTRLSRGYSKECVRRDGTRIPVLIVAIQTAAEREEHAVLVLDDAGRRAAREDLRQTEEMYRQVLDAIPDLAVLRSLDSRIVWANRAFLGFHGTTQDAVVGLIAPPGTSADALRRELREDAVVFDTRTSVDLPDELLIRADGAERIFDTVRSPVTGPDGEVSRILSISRDVTDRSRAERALQRSEANLRTAQAFAHIGSWEVHATYRGDDYWSDETFHILGLAPAPNPPSAAEYIDRVVHPEDREVSRRALDDSVRHGQPLDIEYRILRADGAVRWVRSQGSIVRSVDGVSPTLLGTIRDVTEQKAAEAAREELEARLRQAQKLEAVGTFAGGIAHDFNNLLGALCGYAELALDATGDNPSAQRDLRQVLQAAYRAAELVSRILTFSRQQEQRRTHLRLERPVKESMQLLRATLPATIEIREVFDPRTPGVSADETQILQLMMNLGTNALHAMASCGGSLTVRLEPFHADATFARVHPGLRQGEYALLTVSDTGGGIAPSHVERVLEPFFTTKPPGLGTGLGLSIVHGIVRDHGGAIEVHSTQGVGTEVRIYLPALAGSPLDALEASCSAPRGRGERVLVVDDEPALAELGWRRLEQLGYVPTAFTSSQRALEAFRSHPLDFDLLLTDYTMPVLTGVELVREMRRIRPGLPAVLVSGYGDVVPAESLNAVGLRGLLSKPVTQSVLAKAVREALGAASEAASGRGDPT